jgi:hypothetical protein
MTDPTVVLSVLCTAFVTGFAGRVVASVWFRKPTDPVVTFFHPKPEHPYRANCPPPPEDSPMLVPFVPVGNRTYGTRRECPKCLECSGNAGPRCWGQSWTKGVFRKKRYGKGRHGTDCRIAKEHFHVYCERCDHGWLMATADAPPGTPKIAPPPVEISE